MKSDDITDKNRPVVNVQLSKNENPIAVFMHITLRPILKQKHDTLCSLIRDHKLLNTKTFSSKTELENLEVLKQFFQKNAGLKNRLTGIIIGNFSTEELAFYLENQKELNRRIIEMVITRFLSDC